MKNTLCFCFLALLAVNAESQPAQPQRAQKAALPASAASAAPAVTRPERGVPTSPVVRASEEAQVPGDLRPEKRVKPQVAVPLQRDRAPIITPPASGAGPGQVDDTAARRAATRPAPKPQPPKTRPSTS